MKKRTVDTSKVTEAVEELCLRANFELRADVLTQLEKAADPDSLGGRMAGIIIDNARIAREKKLAICQDTGMVMVYIELGQGVALEGSGLYQAAQSGVKKAYATSALRRSIVADPIIRDNTCTNLPASLHTDIVPGSDVKISVLIKGFGSENKSSVAMLNPTSGSEGVIEFCVESVKRAGADACPPYILAVAAGGSMDTAAYFAKKALFRDITQPSEKPHVADMEKKIFDKVNELGVGPMGLGGITCLGVNMVTLPTHIAGLPVALNISCHALRTAEKVIK